MSNLKLGILMLDTEFLRIPGDVGNPDTFSYDVIKKTISGAKAKLIVRESTPEMVKPFIDAAKELEEEGVKAITTSCGFLAMFQKELAVSVNIPVLASSLLQVNLIAPMLSETGVVGILTANADTLTEKHFRGVGIENIKKVVYGMEGTAFEKIFVDDDTPFDKELIEKLVVEKAKLMIEENPNVEAIVFECTNMPPYAKAVEEATGLPVYDITSLVEYVMSGYNRDAFSK